jgi:hypothetical protein
VGVPRAYAATWSAETGSRSSRSTQNWRSSPIAIVNSRQSGFGCFR